MFFAHSSIVLELFFACSFFHQLLLHWNLFTFQEVPFCLRHRSHEEEPEEERGEPSKKKSKKNEVNGHLVFIFIRIINCYPFSSGLSLRSLPSSGSWTTCARKIESWQPERLRRHLFATAGWPRTSFSTVRSKTRISQETGSCASIRQAGSWNCPAVKLTPWRSMLSQPERVFWHLTSRYTKSLS